MAVLPNDAQTKINDTLTVVRRRRYSRSVLPEAPVSLTPAKVQILRYLAELRFLSLPQLARLCCPAERRDLSEKSARRHMRTLFDAGFVDVLPISRVALTPPETANATSLLYGSAPNVYAPTAQTLKLLCRVGLVGEELLKRSAPDYGPKNSLFLAHELCVRDVRVWLEETARRGDYDLEAWRDGKSATIVLPGNTPWCVRPDAWFVLRLGRLVFFGLVEVDRGTERGARHWHQKLSAYAALFAGEELQRATGYRNARVLVLCPDARRRDSLSNVIEKVGGTLATRFWAADHTALEEPSLYASLWRQPKNLELLPLIS